MTTPYHLKIAPAAHRFFTTLSPKEKKLIIKCLEGLSINPHPPDAKKIEGMTGLYIERINHLHLIYKVEEHEVLLLIIR